MNRVDVEINGYVSHWTDLCAYLSCAKQSIDRLLRYLAITLIVWEAAVTVLRERDRPSSHGAFTTVQRFTIQACVCIRSTPMIRFSSGEGNIIISVCDTRPRQMGCCPKASHIQQEIGFRCVAQELPVKLQQSLPSPCICVSLLSFAMP